MDKTPKNIKFIWDGVKPGRLPGVVDIWLWEFQQPENWPTDDDVRTVITELEKRPDSHTKPVRAAIKKCLDYLGPKGVS